eukprot:4226198-Amphidinium_carterae.1
MRRGVGGWTDDAPPPTSDSDTALTRLLVSSETQIVLVMIVVSGINLLMVMWICHMGLPICCSHDMPSEEDTSERDDHIGDLPPSELTTPPSVPLTRVQNDSRAG